jgi:hypothetical protein
VNQGSSVANQQTAIVEHRDVLQVLPDPADASNDNGMF